MLPAMSPPIFTSRVLGGIRGLIWLISRKSENDEGKQILINVFFRSLSSEE